MQEREEVIAERAESVFPAGVFLAGLKLVPVGLECVQKGAESPLIVFDPRSLRWLIPRSPQA